MKPTDIIALAKFALDIIRLVVELFRQRKKK